jgi:cytochrome c oxidase subunit 2
MELRDHGREWHREVALGRKLYNDKSCNACHTVDGTPRVGPTWASIWGTRVQGQDGSTRTVDDAFVRESIVTPQAFVAAGFKPVMPSFEGQLKPRELDSLVAYIRSLGATP